MSPTHHTDFQAARERIHALVVAMAAQAQTEIVRMARSARLSLGQRDRRRREAEHGSIS